MVVLERGGFIAWGALVGGGILAVKILRYPSARDLLWSLALVFVPVLAWVGTYYYVIGTWESGEVVSLEFDTERGQHVARLWGFGVQIESADADGNHPVLLHQVPASAT